MMTTGIICDIKGPSTAFILEVEQAYKDSLSLT
jgi:hypothetical protein